MAAADLRAALGDKRRERQYCDEWVERVSG
jgi:hypothetical protein